MNFHRFLAYTVLACWIGLTAVVVGTALQWSAARGATEVKIQRALNAQKEATGDTGDATRDSNAGREDEDASSAAQRIHDRLVWRAADASEDTAEAITTEKIVQRQFWWEFAVWGGLTLLTTALLAERRESEERPSGSR